MAFGLPGTGNGGEISPFIKYNAKAGRIFRVDRVQTANGWENEEVDISGSFSAVFDLENLRVGWTYFGPNGPQRSMWLYGSQEPLHRPPDTDDQGKPLYKQGFLLMLALGKDVGGGVREFSSNANCVINAMEALHTEFAAAAERKAGKLPVVKMSGTVLEKGAFGSNYRPVFTIAGWVGRPAALVAPQSQQQPLPVNGNGARPAVPPATGGTQVAAPPPPPPAAAAPNADDFG